MIAHIYTSLIPLKLEYWQSQEGQKKKKRRKILKFYKLKSRSKLTVKVTCLKSMALSYWKGQGIRNTYCAKYERSLSYSKKVMANVQNLVKRHGAGHTFTTYGTIRKALS